MHRFHLLSIVSILLFTFCQPGILRGDPPAEKATAKAPDGQDGQAGAPATPAAQPAAQAAQRPSGAKPKYPPFAEVMEGAEGIEGLIKLYRKDTKLYAVLAPGDLNRDFLVVIAIARGIGRMPVLGGMTWGFGDDWLWQFRKADDRIQIVRRNVRFRAAKGSPQEKAVHLSYTDSVLFSLPIATTSPSGGYVVDLTPIFMSDLPQISQVLRGFMFSAEKSTWASVKGFKDNVEIEVAATYASAGTEHLDTVPDSRGATINVHYSVSRLPETGYEPRPADDRVGYFITAIKDYTKTTEPDRFVRYINRWDLRKADPGSEPSPPKAPIIFWLEKTVPFKYRAPVREGILEWNKAFEKAGFVNAIEVRQQPNDAEWDPEDINYNTFRWITASAAFAMGPSRVNPLTGQILDADIIYDADFLQIEMERYEVIAPKAAAGPEGGPLDPRGYFDAADPAPEHFRPRHCYLCDYARGVARQLAFGSAVLAAGEKPISKEMMEQLVMDAVKDTTIHEVGHTLGLRHNFKGSAYLTLEELGDLEKTKTNGVAASVMDYLAMNLAPKGQKQGAYFQTVLGPYDYWAIEYGYKPFAGGADAELAQLRKIAGRCAEPALLYGTDEDTRSSDPDPLSNRYDLGKDPLAFASREAELVGQALPSVVERLTGEGESYHRARRAVGMLLIQYANAMHYAAHFVGGIYVHRDHKGDPNARPPFVIVEPQKQRAAMDFLQEQVFGQEAFQLPPQLYNYLAPSFWNHWGSEPPARVDFAVHDVVLGQQERVLGQLLSPVTLSRLLDSELKVPADQEAFTAAEMLGRLTAAIFRETEKLQQGEFTNRKPAINSLRRNLQRAYVERLAVLAMGKVMTVPVECQSVAAAELEALEARIKQVLSGKAQLDPYTRAHLSETAALIRKVLDARIQLPGP